MTFTAKAAEEMRLRLAAPVGKRKSPGKITVGTFHAVCLRLLPTQTLCQPRDLCLGARGSRRSDEPGDSAFPRRGADSVISGA